MAGRDTLDTLDPGSARPRLTPVTHDGPARLSSSQLRSWFTYRFDGPNPVNNIPFAAALRGPCDIDALAAAITDVVARHEILRTTYREIDGVPYQVIHPPAEVPVRRADGTRRGLAASRNWMTSGVTSSIWRPTGRSGRRC